MEIPFERGFGVYWFLFVSTLLTPAIVTGIGLLWKKYPPADANWAYGYRTKRSMKSREAWEFAQRHCAKTWLRLGGWMLVLSALGMALFHRWYEAASYTFVFLQVLAILLSLIPTEAALKRNFDEDGAPKER